MIARFWIRTLLTIAVSCALNPTAVAQTTSFYLENTRSLQKYGPFTYADMSEITIGPVTYRIRVTRTGKSFTVSTPSANKVYGPFQFVPGRVVVIDGAPLMLSDIGSSAPRQPAPDGVPSTFLDAPPPANALMELPPPTRAGQPSPSAPAPPSFDDTTAFGGDRGLGMEPQFSSAELEAGIIWQPNTETAYDQGIRGASTTYNLTVDRHIVSAYLKRSGFSLGLGVVPKASWSGILLAAAAVDVNDAEMSDGNGYTANLRYEHTIYSSGKWDIEVFGELNHIHEEYDVNFVAGQQSTQTSVDTNGVVVTNTVTVQSDEMVDSLELNETTARLGASAVYVADPWRAYTGANIVLFDSVDVSTSVHVGESNTRVRIDREGIISGFLGGSVDAYGCRAFAEYMYGETSGFRLGLARRF